MDQLPPSDLLLEGIVESCSILSLLKGRLFLNWGKKTELTEWESKKKKQQRGKKTPQKVGFVGLVLLVKIMKTFKTKAA